MKLDRNITCFKKDYDLNVVQEMLLPYLDKQTNLCIASNTGTGKTNCFNMKAHRHLFNSKEKSVVVYIAPTKALVEEKKQEFEDPSHPYYKLNIVTFTSDYQGRDAGNGNRADVVLMTPESFSHRVRNYTSEKHAWILDIGLLCIDEFHIIDDAQRGAHIEASLINFTKINENAELLLLSATIPNREELTEWIAYLNKHETYCLYSDWRPTELKEFTMSVPLMADKQKTKIELVIDQIKKRKDEQAIIGVFNRAFGQKMTEAIQKTGVKAEFHYGGLKKHEREAIENNFHNKSLQIIVCTKTLFAGVNFPVDYVMATAVEAGGEDVKVYELKQMAGRAGRPQYGKPGSVYYMIDSNDRFDYHVARIQNGEPILSQLGIIANVALHILGAINLGMVTDIDSFEDWYKETLYYHQKGEGQMNVKKLCSRVEEVLVERGMLKVENGKYQITRRGLICTQMSLDPILASELIRNLGYFFKVHKHYDELLVAKALGNCLSYKQFASKDVMKVLPTAITKLVPAEFAVPVSAYYYLLSGEQAPREIYTHLYGYKNDFPRLCQTLSRFGQECENWGEFAKKMLNTLPILVNNKLTYDESYLVSQGATPFQAKRLVKQGVRDLGDI